MKVITSSRCTEYVRSGHPESPQRIIRTVAKLREQKELPMEWIDPAEAGMAAVLRAHTEKHVKSLEAPDYDFDADTPGFWGIRDHALRSAGGALEALKLAREGKKAFSLLRPPGHHATRDRAMGFCYLNSIAIAALEAAAAGVGKVAVYDFDVHHGNGTEAILMDNPRFAYFSVHQHPAYPGTGIRSFGNSFNYPVAPGASRESYRDALQRAFDRMIEFKPELIAVSAGFDAYEKDPLCDEPLQVEDFRWLGEIMRQTGIPSFSVLEGGYSADLPELILAYLKGLEGSGAAKLNASAGE